MDDDRYGCAQATELLAELAVGAIAGEQRADVLRHVAGCPSCRAELAELARVADGLLQLAPPVEPPAGFESAALARIAVEAAPSPSVAAKPRYPRIRRPGRALAAAFALVVAVALGAGAVWWRTAADRSLAARTRQTQELADGRYLKAARLTTVAGDSAGTVFMYEGNPSWLLVTISAAPVDGSYRVVLINQDGRRYPIGACEVASGSGTTAYRLATVASIDTIEMTAPSGVLLTART